MIKEIIGDATKAGADILAHQTNCVGIMGAGIAKQIRVDLLSKEDFEKYCVLCKTHDAKDLMGTVQFLPVAAGREEDCETPLYVANVFGENIPSMRDVDTDYDALRKGLEEVHRFAAEHKYSVCVPGLMGCGLAGGDWNVVRGILEDVFEETDVDLTIAFFNEEFYNQAHPQKKIHCFGSFR